ncbi:MAG: peptidylprolyl isomerase [Mobilitalea sp.]
MEDNEKSKDTNLEPLDKDLQEKTDVTNDEIKKGEVSVIADLLHILGINSSNKKKAASSDINKEDEETYETEETFETDIKSLTVNNDSEFVNQEENRRTYKNNKKVLVPIMILLVCTGLIYAVISFSEPNPPAEDVVGSYNGKNITIEELNNFISVENAKEEEHYICETHGLDHSKCDQVEECETHPVDSLEGYRQLVEMLAVEQIIQDWASAEGVTQRDDVQHGIKDLFSDANVNQLINQIHETEITPGSIPKWEVQQYYDDNKETYGVRAFSEVEDEIRNILVQQKDEKFFPEYIEKLKESSGLEVNFELLRVTEPTDEEITAYYQNNIKNYQTARSAEILEIRINTENTQKKAEEAVVKLNSGETFENVATAYAEDGKALKRTIEEISNDSEIETIAFRMSTNEVSDLIVNEDGSMSIIKLLGISEAVVQPLSDVKNDIKVVLQIENMDEEYSLKKDEALFSVHSKRYTLGDFYTEFKELSEEYQKEFSTFENKKQLVEMLIQKELLLEESGENSTSDENQHDFEELKIQYLSQILHTEKVDNQITEVSEEEIKQFYDKNKSDFVEETSVKLSLIWIGLSEENSEQARKRAEEALALINSGTDFSEVAKQYSEDGTAEAGGQIDEWFYKDYLPEELGGKIFDMNIGEVSDIIESDDGLFIVEVREKQEERQKTYEEMKEMIKEYLNDEKHLELESKMEETLLKDLEFIIYDKTLKKLLKEKEKSS